MKYIQFNTGLPLILPIDKSVNIKWCVDIAFAVHKDMRRHTSGLMTMVIVGAYVQYNKLKLNTKSSTEADIVRLHDVVTQVIRTRYLLKD